MNKTQLHSKTKSELLKLAQRLGLRGISTLNKPELVERISRSQLPLAGTATKQPMSGSAAASRAAAALKRRAVRKRVLVEPFSRPRINAKPAVMKTVARPLPATRGHGPVQGQMDSGHSPRMDRGADAR